MTDGECGGQREATDQRPEPPARRLGVFPGDDYDLTHVRAVDEWLNGLLDVVVTFVRADLTSEQREAFLDDVLTPLWAAGYTPLLTWEPFCLDGDAGAAPAAQLRSRGLLDAWAETLAKWVGSPGEQRELLFRPVHEMNGSWYPWSAGEGVSGPEYVELWTALRDAFGGHESLDDATTWVWCPNADSGTDIALADYYPGDSLVDWVGVDGYNWGASRPESEWRMPADVFEPAFETIRGFSDRPLVVPEVGCSSATDASARRDWKSAWIDAAFEYFQAQEVAFVGWFDANKETDWAVCVRGATGLQDTRTLQGREYGVYPSFERAARRYWTAPARRC